MLLNYCDTEEDQSESIDDEIVQACSGLLEPTEDIAPQKGYFVLKNSAGSSFQVKKGSMCYAFQKKDSVSTDRLYRFIPRNRQVG